MLAELYSNAYCYVLPSTIEGQSIGLLEAMSYGLPCVVGDIPENKETAHVEEVANFVLNLVLVQVWGMYGVVAGTLTSLFIFNFVYGLYLLFKSYFGLGSARAYYLDRAWYLAVAVAVCTVTYLAAVLVPDGGIGWLVAKVVVSLLCSSVMVLVVFCRTARFKHAVAFAKRVLSPASDKGSDSIGA